MVCKGHIENKIKTRRLGKVRFLEVFIYFCIIHSGASNRHTQKAKEQTQTPIKHFTNSSYGLHIRE